MGFPRDPDPDLDYPRDYRAADYHIRITEAKQALEHGEWPTWLSLQGPDAMTVTIVVGGQPLGFPMPHLNALYICRWLLELER